jgi:adenylate cyclase
MVLEVASIYLGHPATLATDRLRLRDKDLMLDAGFHLPLRLAGPTGTIPTISAQDLVAGDPASAAALAGKIVLLGFTAKAVGDSFPSPFGDQMPGVEVLGSAVATLIGGPGLARTESIRLVDLLATVFLATAGTALVARARLFVGLPVALTAVAVWLAGGTVLFASGLWFSAALPLIGAVPPLLATAVLRQRFEQRAARRSGQAVDALRIFHPGALAERITEDPEYLAHPVSQDMAILFVDLAGFTAISEVLGPAQTRTFLKDLHSAVANVVTDGQGMVLNFMGDGAMAVFGLPEPGPNDSVRALQTAFALVPAVRALRLPDGTHPDLRVGVHFGPVIVSRLGHDQQQQVAVSGDAVNLASRLIDIAKDQSAIIAVSTDLTHHVPAASCPEPDVRARVAVRGRMAEVDIALWRTVPET